MKTLTTRQAAALLDCHVTTVIRMVADGRLTPAQILDGGERPAMYLFKLSDIKRLAAKRGAA